MKDQSFEKKINDFIYQLERLNFGYYVEYLKDKRKILWLNFISGVARGFGTAVGFSILGALLLYFLNILVKYNLPVIGKYIADLLKFVHYYMK